MKDPRNEVYRPVIAGERQNSGGPIILTAPEEADVGNPWKKVKLDNNKEKKDAESAQDAKPNPPSTMNKGQKDAAVEEYNEWVPPPDMTPESEQLDQRWSRSRLEFSESTEDAEADGQPSRKLRKLN